MHGRKKPSESAEVDMDPFTSVAVAAGSRSVSLVLEDLYAQAKGTAKSQLEKLRSKRVVEKLYRKAAEVRRVKTIWQVDRAIDLNEFYCATKVKLSNKQVVEISDVEQFGKVPRVIVRGTVGQGKSIFIRYLASRELVKGQRIPVFLELRRIQSSESLYEAIGRELVNLGFPRSPELTDYLIDSGRIVLFLDAFDEAAATVSDRLIEHIESLIRRHEAPVIITTRPDAAICRSTFLDMCDITPLQEGEYQNVVRKVCGVADTAEAIIRGVEESESTVKQVLTTPLMIALLVVRFRAEQSVPETRAAFYEGLFSLLLSRHDKNKAGYIRERKSMESDSALEDFFDNLCFLTRKHGKSPVSVSDMHDIARAACDLSGVRSSVDNVLDDVAKITCLLLEEGGEYRFIHKSVEEYHAARRIRRLPESDAKRVYGNLRSPLRWTTWAGELSFLETMDPYRYLKFFAIPDFCAALGVQSPKDVESLDPADRERAIRFGRRIVVHIGRAAQEEADHREYFVGFSTGGSWFMERSGMYEFLRVWTNDHQDYWDRMAESIGKAHAPDITSDGDVTVNCAEIAEGSSELAEQCVLGLLATYKAAVEAGRQAVQYVNAYEAHSRSISI